MRNLFLLRGLAMLGVCALTTLAMGATVVLEDDFSGTAIDTNKWTVLDTPSAGGTASVTLTGTGKLLTAYGNNTRFQVQGVQSKIAYSVPTGEMLVADMYGINDNGVNLTNSQYSYPVWMLTASATSGSWGESGNFAGMRGKGNWTPDYSRWTGGIADVGTETYAAFKHVIVTVDAANVNLYIEDDYFENLTSPAPVATWATSACFSAQQLNDGLYVVMGLANYQSWYTGTGAEEFDGVKVTVTPEPATGAVVGLGLVMAGLRRRRRR